MIDRLRAVFGLPKPRCVATATPAEPVSGRRIGVESHGQYPGYGWCGRCQTAWPLAPYHTTRYCSHSGCFPLCELCWQELGTPEARMPFYRVLWEQWVRCGTDLPPETWGQIEAAVREGK